MSDLTTSGGSEKEEICAVCKISTKLTCSSCKNVHYCCREHQKSDWKSHWKNCRKFKIVEDVTLGRYYVATRKIEIDELLLSDKKPLLVSPYQGTAPVCLSCYVPLKHENNAKPCDNCGWPLCLDCTKHGPECELTMKYRQSKVIISEYSIPLPIYDAISVLRVLNLRERNPEDYQKFLNLEDHCALMAEQGVTGCISMSIYDVADVVKAYMKIDDLDKMDIARIIGIVGVNGFGHKTAENNDRIVVFAKASYISHSCRPNCRAAIINDLKNEARIVIRAIATIRKGDTVTITYTNPTRGTARRRRILRSTKFFDCTCERCKDPTEFGTMFSAVKCFEKDCTGYMLPSTFLVARYENIPDFICNKCNLAIPSATIDDMMEEISAKFANIDKKDTKQLKTFIDQQTKILHENHFYIFDAKMTLSSAFTHEIKDNAECLSVEFFDEPVTLCKELNSLMKILTPSVYGTRGALLYSQFQYMGVIRDMALGQNPSKFLRLFKESKEVLIEAYRYLRYDQVCPNDASMAEAARLQLAEMNNVEQASL